MALAAHIGRPKAHDLIYEAYKQTVEQGDKATLYDIRAIV
jgi:hypothetical protein